MSLNTYRDMSLSTYRDMSLNTFRDMSLNNDLNTKETCLFILLRDLTCEIRSSHMKGLFTPIWTEERLLI